MYHASEIDERIISKIPMRHRLTTGKIPCAPCRIQRKTLRWFTAVIAQDVRKQFVKNQICFTRLSRWRFYINPSV